jgi:hypothetical protein
VIRLFVLDVPEFRPVIEHVGRSARSRRQAGDYVEFSSDRAIVVDRRAARVRRAVWFSSIAALDGGKVAQFDADELRIEPE